MKRQSDFDGYGLQGVQQMYVKDEQEDSSVKYEQESSDLAG
jgi:hypothetical protein